MIKKYLTARGGFCQIRSLEKAFLMGRRGLTTPGSCGSLTGMPPSRSRRVLVAVAAIVLLAAVFWLKGRTAMADFEVNYRAGGRLLAGETLYRTADRHWQFKYSPFSALVYLPLSFLPLPAAKAIWFGLVAAAIAAVVLLSRRILATAGRPSIWATGLAAAVLARFFLRELQLGQINAVITVLLLLMVIELRSAGGRRPAAALRAGIFWGLATALKPYAVIFLPYFILKRRFRPLLAGLGVVAVSLAVPVVFYGPAGLGTVLAEWVRTLSASTPGLFNTQDNVSLMGLLAKWTGDTPLSAGLFAGLTVLLALLTLAAVLRGRNVPDPLPLDAGLLLLFIPLLSPLGWDYTFLSAYLAVLIVFELWSRFSRPTRAVLALASVLIGLAAFDLLGRRLYASYMAASIPTLGFLVVVAALFQLRRTGEA
jgi:alpha-1,2-mannosyltransferase